MSLVSKLAISYFLTNYYIWIAFPSATCAASIRVSERVGWACTLRAISAGVNSIMCASVSSGRSSVTSGPTKVAPRISPYFSSTTNFTHPAVISQSQCLAVGEERETAHLHRIPAFLGLGFSQPKGGNLWAAIGCPRHHFVI